MRKVQLVQTPWFLKMSNMSPQSNQPSNKLWTSIMCSETLLSNLEKIDQHQNFRWCMV